MADTLQRVLYRTDHVEATLVMTCPTCKVQRLVPGDVALSALIVWECSVCGERETPVFSRPVQNYAA